MKVKTSELIDHQLDWAVASIMPESAPVYRLHQHSKGATIYLHEGFREHGVDFRPSRSWAHGGPVIDRMVEDGLTMGSSVDGWAIARFWTENKTYTGATLLVAAMRCYVASKLGDEFEIPEELV